MSRPLSAPLALFSAGALAIDGAFESVALEESAPLGALVAVAGVVSGAVARLRVGGGVDVTVVVRPRGADALALDGEVIVVEVVVGTTEVVVEIVDVARDEGSFVALDGVDVNVKTKTRRRSGLDHITQ